MALLLIGFGQIWDRAVVERGSDGAAGGCADHARDLSATVQALPGRLSTHSVSHSKSVSYGAFVWARRALNLPKRLTAQNVSQPGQQWGGDEQGWGHVAAGAGVRGSEGLARSWLRAVKSWTPLSYFSFAILHANTKQTGRHENDFKRKVTGLTKKLQVGPIF
jgi:hypothetical protein